MKSLLLTLLFALSVAAVTIVLKDGSRFTGDVICQKSGSLTLKTTEGTVSIFKKSISAIDTLSTEGAREITIADSLVLVNKNDLLFVNNARDTAEVRLRTQPGDTIIAEGVVAPEDTLRLAVPNGTFYENVKYRRGNDAYYLQGQPFTLATSCTIFAKQEIHLTGYPGENIPRLESLKKAFDRP